jgi:hypothetical protein
MRLSEESASVVHRKLLKLNRVAYLPFLVTWRTLQRAAAEHVGRPDVILTHYPRSRHEHSKEQYAIRVTQTTRFV